MKVFSILIFSILLFGCGVQTSADKLGNNSANSQVELSPTVDEANANIPKSIPYESEKVDEKRLEKLENENEKFRVGPNVFKKIDFANFSYPYEFSYDKKKIDVELKDGKSEYKRKYGGGWFSLSDTFFVDLNKDDNKEAVVILWHVSCGGSCDGGSGLFYIYSNINNKLRLIWQHELGSTAYGCGLKSFSIKTKKIIIEQFGRCTKDPSEDENKSYSCKFCVKDITKTIYSIKGKSLVKESSEVVETDETNVMNYSPDISINN